MKYEKAVKKTKKYKKRMLALSKNLEKHSYGSPIYDSLLVDMIDSIADYRLAREKKKMLKMIRK
jgi:hypothetical protein